MVTISPPPSNHQRVGCSSSKNNKMNVSSNTRGFQPNRDWNLATLARVLSGAGLVFLFIVGINFIVMNRDGGHQEDFDPHKILGIDPEATLKDIKRAYRKQALQFHPEKSQSESNNARFEMVAKAYEALTEPNANVNYEKYGNADGTRSASMKSRTHHYSYPESAGLRKKSASAPASPNDSFYGHSFYQNERRDKFQELTQNTVKRVSEEPVSTFSADVDTTSYSFVRRAIKQHGVSSINQDAVRTEEFINYFDYDYALPKNKDQPFQPSVAVSDSPWNVGRKLLYVGIKGYEDDSGGIGSSANDERQRRSNLVFLLDVSGSMGGEDRLPLVKRSMELLLTTLDPHDHVAIVTYSNEARTVLQPTDISNKNKILSIIRSLSAGGGTYGAGGLQLAYDLLETNFDKSAVNRIIMASDGDFNVGMTDESKLKALVEKKRDSGIFLSVLGFGMGNYQDKRMQTLANYGNGVAAYIDSLSEAHKVLVNEARSTLFPIAKDVKIQVEFNPAMVKEYRLLGYEKRLLNREDFNNDKVDAGDIGCGHTVTAIYEITPVGSNSAQIDELRYDATTKKSIPVEDSNVASSGKGNEYAFLKIRYKLPHEQDSKLISKPIYQSDFIDFTISARANDTRPELATNEGSIRASRRLRQNSPIDQEFGFATAVAGFAEMLRGGKYIPSNYSYNDIIKLAEESKGQDIYGYRTEFIQLVRLAKDTTVSDY